MLNRGQVKGDFVSTVARSGSPRRPGEQFSGPQIKQDAGATLDAPSRIHTLKHTPLDRRRLLT